MCLKTCNVGILTCSYDCEILSESEKELVVWILNIGSEKELVLLRVYVYSIITFEYAYKDRTMAKILHTASG